MALTQCPECGRENVSDSAEKCPDCGFGIKAYFEKLDYERSLLKAEEESNKSRIEKLDAERQLLLYGIMFLGIALLTFIIVLILPSIKLFLVLGLILGPTGLICLLFSLIFWLIERKKKVK